ARVRSSTDAGAARGSWSTAWRRGLPDSAHAARAPLVSRAVAHRRLLRGIPVSRLPHLAPLTVARRAARDARRGHRVRARALVSGATGRDPGDAGRGGHGRHRPGDQLARPGDDRTRARGRVVRNGRLPAPARARARDPGGSRAESRDRQRQLAQLVDAGSATALVPGAEASLPLLTRSMTGALHARG